MPSITPFLWFDNNASKAAFYYASVFPNVKVITPDKPTGDGEQEPFMAVIEIDGQRFNLMNGGPAHKLTEAFSLYVDCKDQAEVDHYWNTLLANGGNPNRCGWLTDKFGVSWQVIPKDLPRMLSHPDPEKAGRATAAMMKMQKIDIATMQRAFDNEET